MKVALVAPRFAPDVGGVEAHVHELATRFADRGNVVDVLVQTANRSLPRESRQGNLTVRRFPVMFRSNNYAFSWQLPQFVAHNHRRYDLIHVHSYHALPALGGALSAGDQPVVFTPHYHGTGHSAFRSVLHRPYRLAGRLLFRRSDQVICVSDAEASLVAQHFPGVVSKIEVIPNGVDTSDLTSAVPFHIRERVVLSVGRLEGYKHVEDVVSAMRHLDESYVLRIVGEGPDDKRLRRHVTSLGLQSRVEFLGRVDRACLCRWYRTAAVYVNVSTREAFGIGALEALASGATLVLSDIPAHREMLSKYAGGRGCVARHPDIPAHLADAIKASVCDRRDAVSAPLLPSWDSVSEETGDLYVSVIGRRQRQARR